ncbi:hypothetical protein [Sporolactobacillus terrae]|uniref:hypothetical protein n=1 Tax=Sporolactobacillus terrae TaxID=269673 RepID=UPI000A4E8FF6|nr:hypothetical protein [Sporolactobacillus terrae]
MKQKFKQKVNGIPPENRPVNSCLLIGWFLDEKRPEEHGFPQVFFTGKEAL